MSLFRLDTFMGKIVAFSFGLVILAGIIFASLWQPFSRGTPMLSSSIPWVFAVNGANFPLEERKIPFDSKTIDITFSLPLDPVSVTPETVRISPSIAKGKVENGNTLRFSLDTPLEKGEEYTISIGSGVRNNTGKPLGKDVTYRIRAGENARVTNIFPQGNLENIDQNVIVTFSLPMIPLAKLDTKDTFSCPLTITPSVNGRCHWLNSSTLEFIPERSFQNATTYRITVEKTGSLLFPLSLSYTATLMTPPLSVTLPSHFLPENGIPLILNAAVEKAELEKYVRVFSLSGNTWSLAPFEYTLTQDIDTDGTKSDTFFHIMPRNGVLWYSEWYRVEVGSGLLSKYGTEPLLVPFSGVAHALDLITDIRVIQRVYSTSGVLVDTVILEKDDPYIPVANAVFDVTFARETSLEESKIVFQNGSWVVVPYTLEYGTMQDPHSPTEKIIEDKTLVRIIPKGSLMPWETYTLTVWRAQDPAQKEAIVRSFTVAPKMRLALGKVLSNTQVCLYSSSALMNDSQRDISMTPNAPIRSLKRDGRDEWDGGSIQTKMLCPVLSGSIAYILSPRLSPNTAYTLTFGSGFRDAYGNRLWSAITFPLTSVDIAPGDRLLYSSYSKDTEVIPSDLPIVVNLLTANLDTVTFDVCEMDKKQYVAFLSERFQEGYTPSCSKQVIQKMPLKNQYWTLSVNKFDLARDILRSEIVSPYILVTAYVEGFKNPKTFMEAKKVEHLFIRSNLSLTLERGASGAILFASSFDGKKTPSDLTFEAYEANAEGAMIPMKFTPQWNAAKKFYEISLDRMPMVLLARNAEFFGSLSFSMDQVSNYDFRYISWQDSFENDYLYIYSDRPLYRAGDTIYFKWLLRHFSPVGYIKPREKTWKLQIVDDDWVILYETGVTLDANANFHGTYILPKDMKQGRYRFQFFTGEWDETTMVYNNGEFYVSDYKKPVFAVDVSVDTSDAVLWDHANLSVDALYYFGGKIPWAQYILSVLTQSYFFDAKEYWQYQFWKGSDTFDCIYWWICSYGDSLDFSASGLLDGEWHATFTYQYPTVSDEKADDHGEKIYSYTFEVTDPDTGKTVADTVSQILHMTDAYVGIRTPYWNTSGEDIWVDGVILDHAARGLANKEATLELWKSEWKEVKKQWVDGNFYNEFQEVTKKESSVSVRSNAKGEFRVSLRALSGGTYEVRALYTGKNKQTFTSTSWIYVSGPDTRYYEWNNSVTELVADETMLRVGDIARFTLQSPILSGKAFIAVEKDDMILDAFTRDITGASLRIEIPITEKHVPNIYVKAFLIGKNPWEKLPTYRRALSVVKVQPDAQKLHVTLTPEKGQYLPWERMKATVMVRDVSGKPVPHANGSLVVVDQSLLALAGNPVKNPFAFFYDMKRYLGVETYLSLAYLIEKLEVKDTTAGEKGGAWEKGWLSVKKRGVFKDTAFWVADFTTDSGGTATLTTDALPDNLTTWVLESIVSTSDTNRIGIATAFVRTNKLVMINENLPRFLGSSDTVRFAPVVFNKTNTTQDFTVTLTGTNISGKNLSQSVQIASGTSRMIPFEVTVADTMTGGRWISAAMITIHALGTVTWDEDTVENTLPILLTATSETVATVGRTESTADEPISVDEAMRSYSGGLIITYASTLLPNLLSGMDFLTNFSYGCSEQRTAGLMPILLMKKASDRLGIPYDLTKKTIPVYIDAATGYEDRSVDTLIRNYMTDILTFQNEDGGFAYWQKSGESDYPLSNILLSAFGELRALGYDVDRKSIDRAIAYLKKEFYTNQRPYCSGTGCGWSNMERFRTLEAILSLNPDDYEVYKMYLLIGEWDISLSESVDRYRTVSRLMKLSGISWKQKEAFSGMIDVFIRDSLNNALVTVPRGAYLRSSPYERTGLNARFLELASRIGYRNRTEYKEIFDQIQRWILSQKQSDGSFGSTAQTAEVLRSLFEGLARPSSMKVAVTLDTTPIMQTDIVGSGVYESFSGFIPLPSFHTASMLHLAKQGSGTLFYDLALTTLFPARTVTSRDEWFYIDTVYYDYDAYLNILTLQKHEWEQYLSGTLSLEELQHQKNIESYLTPLREFSVWKLVYVSNHVITGEMRDRVAFEGFIPAGTELVDTNMKTENMKHQQEIFFDHTEWRDDRYFGYSTRLEAGEYRFSYLLRPTHAGVFSLRPSRIFEFYRPEIFGRTAGKSVTIIDAREK